LPRRKERLRVVFDTNLVVRHFLSYRKAEKENFNRRVFELWFIGNQLQLIVAPEIVEEYLMTMKRVLGTAEQTARKWERRT
jgi:predicted nucleic acid-binding protein